MSLRNTYKYFFFVAAFISFFSSRAQLNCRVEIIKQRYNDTLIDTRQFPYLKQALAGFMNTTQWDSVNLKEEERINVSILIAVDSVHNNTFTGSMQVTSSRPVFNSDYKTTVFN